MEQTESHYISPLLKSPQVIENQLEIALAHGFELPAGLSKTEFLQLILDKDHLEKFKATNVDLYRATAAKFREIISCRTKIRQQFAKIINEIVDNPSHFGVDIVWRETQKKALKEFAEAFHHGYQRLPFQIATGGGKSLIFGAIIRAYLETINLFNQEIFTLDEEVVLLTSRNNLISQMMTGGTNGEDEDENDEGQAIKIGEVMLWIKNLLNENQIRILTGDSNRSKLEKQKRDVDFTIETYQGFTPERIEQLHKTKPVGLILLDEAHNATGRICMLINQLLPEALLLGGSATIKGPERNPFLLFEEIIRNPAKQSALTWQEKLAFNEGIIELISRGELKPVRWLQGKIAIDLSQIAETSKGKLNEEQLGDLIAKNINALKQFIKKSFEESSEVLKIMGTKSLNERTHIAFVKRLAIAQELAEYCSQELGIKADYVSGEDTVSAFQEKKRKLASGEIQMLFSCRKLTEGFDEVRVNCVWLLWPHPLASEWQLGQEIGRGIRKNPFDPFDDALYIDGVYNAGRHELASIMGLFGQYHNFQGGLLAPGLMRDVEMKILSFMQEGKNDAEILESLTEEERKIAEIIWKGRRLPVASGNQQNPDHRNIILKSLELVERDDVKRILERLDQALFQRYIVEQLNQKGVFYREELIEKGKTWFIKEVFGNMSGQVAGGKILGRPIALHQGPNQFTLEELADKLGLPEKGQEQALKDYRLRLNNAEIYYEEDLIEKGKEWFLSNDFGGISGCILGRKILGRPINTVKDGPTSFTLSELAQKVALPKKGQKRQKKENIQKFNKKGIYYQEDLIKKGKGWLFAENFGEISGAIFAGKILGRSITTLKDGPSSFTMQELAEKLGLPKKDIEVIKREEAEQLERNRKLQPLFHEKGIRYKEDLVKRTKTWFLKEKFGAEQKSGYILGKEILGRPITDFKERPTSFTMDELAQKLDLPEKGIEAQQQEIISLFAAKGIYWQEDLASKSKTWFFSQNFGDIGPFILGKKILGRTIGFQKENAQSFFTMEELAEKSGLPRRS